MVYFQNKISQFGKVFNGHLVNVTAISYLYDHVVYCFVILVYFARFGMLYQEKSGNPAQRNREEKMKNHKIPGLLRGDQMSW
jgi:preprotein translocase subunit SecY